VDPPPRIPTRKGAAPESDPAEFADRAQEGQLRLIGAGDELGHRTVHHRASRRAVIAKNSARFAGVLRAARWHHPDPAARRARASGLT
jgi:hypothetical protein